MNKYSSKIAALALSCSLTGLFGVSPVCAAKTGWDQQNGNWYWIDENGSTAKSCWKEIGNTTYHFGPDGKMTKGWYTEDGDTYFFDNSGAMKIGWLKQGNDWYYFSWDWSQLPGLDASQYPKKGSMVKGVFSIPYLGTSSPLAPHYYSGSDGKMKTGWITFEKNGKTIEHYFDSSGMAKFGWLKQGDNWLYMLGNARGKAMNGWVEEYRYSENGNRIFYYLNDKGVWTDTKTVKLDDPTPQPVLDLFFDR